MEQLGDKSTECSVKKSKFSVLKIWAAAIVATALCTVVFRLPFFQNQLLQVKIPRRYGLSCLHKSKVKLWKFCNCYPNGFSDRGICSGKDRLCQQLHSYAWWRFKEVTRKCVVIVSFLVFLTALSLLFYNMIYLSLRNAELNGEIQRIAPALMTVKQHPKRKKDGTINWDKLLKINDEIVGWIQMKDTHIDYPVLWHKADSTPQQYYLNHNYKNGVGRLRQRICWLPFNKGVQTAETLFFTLTTFRTVQCSVILWSSAEQRGSRFLQKVPTFRFDTPKGKGTYKIISVFKTNTLTAHGDFFNYMISDFENDKDFMNYVYNVRVRSSLIVLLM